MFDHYFFWKNYLIIIIVIIIIYQGHVNGQAPRKPTRKHG